MSGTVLWEYRPTPCAVCGHLLDLSGGYRVFWAWGREYRMHKTCHPEVLVAFAQHARRPA